MLITQIKTASQFRAFFEDAHPNSHFFTRENMKFAGDTMANYKLIIHADSYELARRKPVKHGLKASAYFDKLTLRFIGNN